MDIKHYRYCYRRRNRHRLWRMDVDLDQGIAGRFRIECGAWLVVEQGRIDRSGSGDSAPVNGEDVVIPLAASINDGGTINQLIDCRSIQFISAATSHHQPQPLLILSQSQSQEASCRARRFFKPLGVIS